MNRNKDMNHLKSPATLREELAEGKLPSGIYGDSVGGRSFTDRESTTLESRSRQARSVGAGWYSVYAGPGTTKWTIINCSRDTDDERTQYEEAMASDQERR